MEICRQVRKNYFDLKAGKTLSPFLGTKMFKSGYRLTGEVFTLLGAGSGWIRCQAPKSNTSERFPDPGKVCF